MTTEAQAPKKWGRQVILFLALLIPGYIMGVIQGLTVGWLIDDIAVSVGGALSIYVVGLIGRLFKFNIDEKFNAQLVATLIVAVLTIMGVSAF